MNRFFTTLLATVLLPAATVTAAEEAVPATIAAKLLTESGTAADISGETVSLARESQSYMSIQGFVIPVKSYNSVAELVKSADGTSCTLVYPIAELSTKSITGTIAGGKVSFALPQKVNQVTVDEDGTPATYDIYVTTFSEVEVEPGVTSWVSDGKPQTMVFTLGDDGSLTADNEKLMMGVGADMGDDGMQWLGFGDVNIRMTPMTDKAVEVPSGLVTENYVVRNMDSPYIAQVGFDGEDIYVKGLVSGVPEGWIKGKVSEGKVTFDNGQYLGIAHTATTYRNYVYCVVTTQDYDSEFNVVYAPIEPTFEVSFDSEKKNLSFATSQIVCMSVSPDQTQYIKSIAQYVSLEYRGVFEPTTPPEPVIESFTAYDETSGYGEIDFTMPDNGADGKVLDYSNYFYNVYVDGKLYEVKPDVYPSVTEAMTDIPYSYTEENDFYTYPGGYHMFYFRIPEYKSIALQSVYTVGGVTNKSGLVYAVGESGVEEVRMDASKVINEEYFDLTGRRTTAKSKGIVIKRETLSDGSVRTSKCIL